MHIDISACGDAPCWVYSNKNVSGQFYSNLVGDGLVKRRSVKVTEKPSLVAYILPVMHLHDLNSSFVICMFRPAEAF